MCEYHHPSPSSFWLVYLFDVGNREEEIGRTSWFLYLSSETRYEWQNIHMYIILNLISKIIQFAINKIKAITGLLGA